eukprot:TRINITY_DN3871_c0_g3_i8.p1 TRINITY_DN3871_c0_g3~~TRINITY_DN3871_c0_g3_i8.p1  ORF type:complete len:198 (-),score=77.36 TRINITY_DN3871_c0_g3_i8:113-706(-)
MQRKLMHYMDMHKPSLGAEELLASSPIEFLKIPLIPWNQITLLHYSGMRGYPNIIEFLVDKGIPVDEQDNMGRTALHYAAANNEIEATRRLLKFGANINAQTIGGDTPLMKATELGHFEIVKELMSWSCNFGLKNKSGKSAEDIAKSYGVQNFVKPAFENAVQRIEARVFLIYLYSQQRAPFSKITPENIFNICNYI